MSCNCCHKATVIMGKCLYFLYVSEKLSILKSVFVQYCTSLEPVDYHLSELKSFHGANSLNQSEHVFFFLVMLHFLLTSVLHSEHMVANISIAPDSLYSQPLSLLYNHTATSLVYYLLQNMPTGNLCIWTPFARLQVFSAQVLRAQRNNFTKCRGSSQPSQLANVSSVNIIEQR